MLKKTLSLKQYSTAAVALIGSTATYSQVAYTDIDPDIVLDKPDEIFGIDLDDDGLNDFNFFNESFTTTVFYSDLANVKAIFVGAFDSMQNGIVGSTGYLSGGGGYSYFFPYVLDEDEVIGSFDNFYNDNYQTLAMEIDKFTSPFEPSHQGNWYYFYGAEVVNKFIGLRFVKADESLHYGWIRCSVIDSGRTLIIHDYAYETTPNKQIIAGDTLSYVDINNSTTIDGVEIYSNNQIITIKSEKKYFSGSNIVDMSGKVIITNNVESKFLEFDITQLPKGMYLVNIFIDKKNFCKKIFKY